MYKALADAGLLPAAAKGAVERAAASASTVTESVATAPPDPPTQTEAKPSKDQQEAAAAAAAAAAPKIHAMPPPAVPVVAMDTYFDRVYGESHRRESPMSSDGSTLNLTSPPMDAQEPLTPINCIYSSPDACEVSSPCNGYRDNTKSGRHNSSSDDGA